MALNKLVDSRDLRFILFEMLEVDTLNKYPKYGELDKGTMEEVLALAEKIAVEQVYPANAQADKIGVKYDPATKKVTVPEPFKPGLKAYHEAGFMAMAEEPELGGMGMPIALALSVSDIFTAASLAFTMYPGLTHGAAMLINTFGTQEQKDTYLEKMLTGVWGGTMALTEPEAGSDVGNLKTKAVKQADGTYRISGQKIFITAAENDVYENIIHPVLARIEGDPPGTKGISIFIVPKFLVNKDGSVGAKNDVVCTGTEHKMGIHASATCSMSFGDNGSCVGYLLGQERQGMKIMFQMMNEARLGVAMQGLSVSSTAYMHAVTYAKNRTQGVHVTQMLNPEAPKVAIIQHPDVKRMLLYMKSYVEGMRMLVYYLGHTINMHEVGDADMKKECMGLAEILIPIAKAGNTDMSVLVSSEAIQVYGGYGYCADYPVEQFMRDSKITAVYEGTNGIQSMDLTMRKILMNPEQYNYSVLKKRMAATLAKAKGVVEDRYLDLLDRGIKRLDEVIEMMKKQMGEGKFLHLFMNATPLQQAMFMLALAWLHIESLAVSMPRMKALVGDKKGPDREKFLEDNDEAAFYNGRVLSSQFYLGMEFPKYFGRIETLTFGDTSVIKAGANAFTGAPAE